LKGLVDSLGDSVYGLILGQIDPVSHVDDEIGRSQAGGPPQVGLKGVEGFPVEIPVLGGQVRKVGHVNEEGEDGCTGKLLSKPVHLLRVQRGIGPTPGVPGEELDCFTSPPSGAFDDFGEAARDGDMKAKAHLLVSVANADPNSTSRNFYNSPKPQVLFCLHGAMECWSNGVSGE